MKKNKTRKIQIYSTKPQPILVIYVYIGNLDPTECNTYIDDVRKNIVNEIIGWKILFVPIKTGSSRIESHGLINYNEISFKNLQEKCLTTLNQLKKN